MSYPLNKKLLIQGLFGNVIEWYDFALYGYFASKISSLFFPYNDNYNSMILTYIVFSIGLLMRPIGGVLFGYIGDKYGRTRALITSIFLMAIPTCLIGILPTYETIGIWSSILLTVCRFFQGVAVGGEFTCSMVYILESVPEKKRGFYSSWIMLSAFIGILLGSAVSALVDYLFSGSNIEEWAWRLPFISGILLLILGFYYRKNMPESPQFIIGTTMQQNSSVKYVIWNEQKKVLHAIFIVMLPSMSFYLVFVYLATYLKQHLEVPLSISLGINTISMLLLTIAIPFFGAISDIIGRKPITLIGTFGFILLSYPLFTIIVKGNYNSILLSQCIFAILVAMIYSVVPVALFEMFHSSIRCTAVSIPYNIANSIFGGTAPLISTILIEHIGILGPSFYLIFIAILAISSNFYFQTRLKLQKVKD